ERPDVRSHGGPWARADGVGNHGFAVPHAANPSNRATSPRTRAPTASTHLCSKTNKKAPSGRMTTRAARRSRKYPVNAASPLSIQPTTEGVDRRHRSLPEWTGEFRGGEKRNQGPGGQVQVQGGPGGLTLVHELHHVLPQLFVGLPDGVHHVA